MKEFTKNRLILFLASGILGYLFYAFSIPIPYVLGGIIGAFTAKTFIDKSTKWPALWRNLMMCVAGYEIGKSCTIETVIKKRRNTSRMKAALDFCYLIL